MKNLVSVTLVAVLILNSNYSLAGSSAHGGDLDLDQNNIWFLGSDPIEYCVESVSDYPFHDELDGLIEEAVDKWKTLFQKYEISNKSFSGFKDGQVRKMTLAFKKVETCDPDPKKRQRQIRFLFGKMDALVKQFLTDGNGSLGAAVRYSYDHKTYRTGGTVWLKNWTARRDHIMHMLVHELGHVFGMKHDSVWVMEAKIAQRLVHPLEQENSAYGNIESPDWPFKLAEGELLDFTYRGKKDTATGLNMYHNFQLPALLEVLGLPLDEKHSLRLRYNLEGIPDFPFGGKKVFVLIVTKPDGRSRRYRGEFEAITKHAGGPAVYTDWKNANGSTFWRKKYLLQTDFPVPAHGFFNIDGKKVAATIRYENGPILGIFAPALGVWTWTSVYEKNNIRFSKVR